MNTKLALGSLGIATLLSGASSMAAEAQIYQDLNGQLVRLTGVVSYQLSLTVNAVITTVSTNITGTATLGPTNGLSWVFTGNGAVAPESISASIPLPSLDGIALPNLPASGTWQRDTGVFNALASLPGTTVEVITISGFTATLSVTNPNISLIGQAVNPPNLAPDTAVIDNTTEPVVNAGLAGCVNVLGCDSIDFVSKDIYFENWTITAIPAPSSLAVLTPGLLSILGGLSLRRRRRRKASAGSGSDPTAGSDGS